MGGFELRMGGWDGAFGCVFVGEVDVLELGSGGL